MTRLTINCPAKINIGLHIFSKRSDKFYHIFTYIVPIDFYDKLSIHFIKKQLFKIDIQVNLQHSYKDDLSNYYNDPQSITSLDKTYSWLQAFPFSKSFELSSLISVTIVQKLKEMSWGVELNLEKNIPSPCGLGGASSNAAALLKGYLKLLKKTFTVEEVQAIEKYIFQHCYELGSDIPLLFINKAGIIDGRYECRYTTDAPQLMGILAIPNQGCSTKDMYSCLKKTLQINKKTKNIQKIKEELEHLVDYFMSFRNKDIKNKKLQLMEKELSNVIDIDHYIQNDFSHVLQQKEPKLFHKILNYMNMLIENTTKAIVTSIIGKKILKQSVAITTLKNIVYENTYTSLNGSGSSFYMITNIYPISHVIDAKSSLQKIILSALNNYVDDLTETYPQFTWRSFSSIV